MDNKDNKEKMFIEENALDIDEPSKKDIIKKHKPFYIFISVLIVIVIILAITVAVLAK